MFDMGFEPQIGMFLQSTRPDKQVAMFSATLPAHVEALARKAGQPVAATGPLPLLCMCQVLKKPIEISAWEHREMSSGAQVGERNSVASNVTQFVEAKRVERGVRGVASSAFERGA